MIRYISACLIFIVYLLSCTEPKRELPPDIDLRYTITVEGTVLHYNGHLLSWDTDIAKWYETLGPPTRKVGRISVWDDRGLLLYNGWDTVKPVSFVVTLGKTPHSKITESAPSFWPYKLFLGKLYVDGALVHRNAIISEINTQKSDPDFQKGYLPTIYDYENKNFYLRIDFGHDGSMTSFGITSKDLD